MATKKKHPIDAKWFRLMFDRANVTQNAVAQAVGVDKSSMSKMLNGERRIQVAEIKKLARILDLSEEEVYRHAGHIERAAAGTGAQVIVSPAKPATVAGGVIDAASGEVTFNGRSDAADAVTLQVIGDPFLANVRIVCRPSEVSTPSGAAVDFGLVQLADGRVMLRKFKPSFVAGRFDLGPVLGFGARTEDVEIVGVIPVSGLERV
ncbi:helix-turn-helix domain-containing protein [Dyella kyungheensis]|uniref:helix-turn-helix domain-containing protein n=1 Tax=Dyella kyungheensis TaxID=1242174 RepID=UPI003CFAFD71